MFRLVHEMQLLKGQIKHSCVKYTGSIVEMFLFFYISKRLLLAPISTTFIPGSATICQLEMYKRKMITISAQILEYQVWGVSHAPCVYDTRHLFK